MPREVDLAAARPERQPEERVDVHLGEVGRRGAGRERRSPQHPGGERGVLRTEPVTEKWQAFGWHALRVDGNDVPALVAAFDELRAHRGSPGVLICDTRVGRGVPLLETREKAHFMRVEEHEWQIAQQQLEEGYTA